MPSAAMAMPASGCGLGDLKAAVSVDCNLKGQDCQWGGHALDQLLLPAMVTLALGRDVVP